MAMSFLIFEISSNWDLNLSLIHYNPLSKLILNGLLYRSFNLLIITWL